MKEHNAIYPNWASEQVHLRHEEKYVWRLLAEWKDYAQNTVPNLCKWALKNWKRFSAGKTENLYAQD